MVKCPGCGKERQKLGNHWHGYPSHRPKFSQKQKNIITGLLMSDAWLERSGKNPRLCIENINKDYLQYLSGIFGCLGVDVRLQDTAAESAKNARKSGFRPQAKKENYNNVYYWALRRNPKLKKYKKWYSSGEKKWPKSLNLNKYTLKHLHAGDGTFEKDNHKISIAARNERGNKEKISNYFKEKQLPKPKWHTSKLPDGSLFSFYWCGDKADEIFKYMGEAPPGFEYKWPY